ncbi:MAG: hypothetical protein K0Q53_101 [Massilibacillus sp.]|jgi:hypothetical protein|nr:hypothetical protein [Massilibacillus sp.]
MIKKTMFAASPLGKEKDFCEAIAKDIDEIKNAGLEVEIHYQASTAGYSAIILGKEKIERILNTANKITDSWIKTALENKNSGGKGAIDE